MKIKMRTYININFQKSMKKMNMFNFKMKGNKHNNLLLRMMKTNTTL